MRIKILHPIPGYAYFGGEVATVTDAQGGELVAYGHAVMIPDTEQEISPVTPIKAYVREQETIKTTVQRKRK